MSSRRNYLDADNSIMERNLRFVKNDLEDNLNQYFGGSGSRGSNSTTVTAPPRDYKVVQPKPGSPHANAQSDALEKRRKFLLQLGLARHEAYELAKNNCFDVNRYEQNCREWLDSGIWQAEVNNRILCDLRNENNWNKNIAHNNDEISSKTVAFKEIIEERDHTKRKGSGYNDNYEEHSRCNLSRARSKLYARKGNDYSGERNHQSISRSPNRGLSSIYEDKKDEYFSQQDNPTNAVIGAVNRAGSRSSLYSPPRNDRRDERYQPSKSRSPERTFNTTNEEYFLQHENFKPERGRDTTGRRLRSYSPSMNYLREERFSRSRSPNRVFNQRNAEEYHEQQNNYIVDLRKDRTYKQPHVPPKNDARDERYKSSRSRSPNRSFNSMQERESENYLLEHDNFRKIIREQSRSPAYSTAKNDYREDLSQSSRSHSLSGDFNEGNRSRYFSQPENFRKTIRERSRSRSYSPPRNYRREEFYQSRSPNRELNSRNERLDNFSSQYNNFKEQLRGDTNYFDGLRETSASNTSRFQIFDKKHNNTFDNAHRGQNSFRNIPTQQNREIPSLLTLDTFPKQTQISKRNSQDHNIPSLLTLQIFPDQGNIQQPSTKQIAQYGNNKQTKFNNNKARTEQMKKQPDANMQSLKQHVSNIPTIKSGLEKPPPGHLKANPQEYWSQWWPQYKYIEYSIPKINPNDNEVKTCINFLYKPYQFEFRRCKQLLLGIGVKSIMKTVDINETNYYVRDIYKLLKYKKHLEDPNFQNNLDPQDLNCIAPALRQFQIKSTMAYLHQAMICRWHISLDIIKKVQAGEPIMSNYARMLLNDKCFHYLVMESIQELKKMCQQDWPRFPEFYKNIKATKVDIYSMGLGPNVEVNNAN